MLVHTSPTQAGALGIPRPGRILDGGLENRLVESPGPHEREQPSSGIGMGEVRMSVSRTPGSIMQYASQSGSSGDPTKLSSPPIPFPGSLHVPNLTVSPDVKQSKIDRKRRREKIKNKPLPPTPPSVVTEVNDGESTAAGDTTDETLTISPSTSHSSGSVEFLSPVQVYTNLRQYAEARASRSGSSSLFLDEITHLSTRPPLQNPVESVIDSYRYFQELDQILTRIDEATQLEPSDNVRRHDAYKRDQNHLCDLFKVVLSSPLETGRVLELKGTDAKMFMDAIQLFVYDHPLFDHSIALNGLLVQLSKQSTGLPDSLFISGVAIVKEHNSYGGTFGDIYRSTYQGKYVALKRLRLFQNSDRTRLYRKFCQEARVWHRLQHRFILPFLGVDAENFPLQPCLVSPWMANGTVIQFLQKHPKANYDKMLYEIAQGVSYLHSEGVVHGDLKGANILIDEERHPRLADFGLTILADATQQYSTDQGGTMRFMAPELLNPPQFNKTFQRTFESDVYAYACVCVEVYTGKPPFGNLPFEGLVIEKVTKGLRPDRVSSMTDELWNVVTACWDQLHDHRLTANAVVIKLKEILRRSATSSIDGLVMTPSTSSSSLLLKQTIPENESGDRTVSSTETMKRSRTISGLRSMQTTRPTRRAREDGEDERSYSLQPIRTHADPSRTYREVPVQGQSDSSNMVHTTIARLNGTRTLAKIKKIDIASQTPKALNQLADEFLAMRYLHHPNLLNYLDVFKYEDRVWVVTEHLNNALSLRKVIVANSGASMPKKELFAKTVLRGLFEAVSYLHRQNLYHGYINPENVLFVSKLGSQNSLPIRLKLCAMISDNHQVASRSRCSAPEIGNGSEPSPQSDVWDIGILTLEMLDGQHVLDWTHSNPLEMLFASSLLANLSADLLLVLGDMLDGEPDNRLSASELLTHAFLTKQKSKSGQ